MIGGRRPLTGRKAGDRRDPGRAAACPVLPLHRPRPARRARGSVPAADPRWARLRARSRPSSSAGHWRARPTSKSGCRRRRRSRSSARTRSRPRPTPRRRSCGSWSSPARPRCCCRSRSSIAIAILLAVVAVSYRQVCRAYPNGGGAYVVARTNLAPIFGLIAAASLLIDYVMTVAVSTASAIAQIQSVVPAAYDVRIEIAFVSIGADHDRQPARPARVREHLRGPDLPVRRPGARRSWRSASRRSSTGTAQPIPPRPDSRAARDRATRHPAAPQGVRRRVGRADRRRGDRERRPGVQAARVEERRQHHDRRWPSCSASCSSG